MLAGDPARVHSHFLYGPSRMIFTTEERRAIFAVGLLLLFGQAVSSWERWRDDQPDRELSAWLTELAVLRTEATGRSDGGYAPTGSADADRTPARSPVQPRPAEEIPPGILATGRLRVDLATRDELETLPGVGPALAGKILAAREVAPFETVEDLLRVPGIGPKTLERLRSRIAVGP